jgi:hypothetical protein
MKTKILSLLAAGALTATSAFAGTVVFSSAPDRMDSLGAPYGRGGAFIIETSDMGTFTGFCLEINEAISMGVVYNYSIGGAATLGGAGGGNPDPLSVGSAWLIRQYASGAIGGTKEQARDIQLAFWILENELDNDANYGDTTSYVTNNANPYLASVISKFNGLSGARLAAAIDQSGRGAQVLNPTTDRGLPRQSVVIYVPDSGTTLILLGLGLGLVGLVSRRVRS